jgi:prepilin-type N-terminal cleavage/methylation domain-containing protein
MSRSRRDAGFTLLEVLVALAMFALLMGMLTSGVRLVMRSYETGTQQTDRLSQLSVVVDVLRDQIGNARMGIPGRTEEQGPSFIGALDHLEFVGSLPSQFAVGGLQTIFVGLRQDKAERGAARTMTRRCCSTTCARWRSPITARRIRTGRHPGRTNGGSRIIRPTWCGCASSLTTATRRPTWSRPCA